MQTYFEGEQASLFAPDTFAGRMSQAASAQARRTGRISGLSSKNSSELISIPFMSLDLTPGAGNLLDEFYWEILSPWRGESLILNTGPAPPSGAAGSILWSILEEKPHPRYFFQESMCRDYSAGIRTGETPAGAAADRP